MTLDQLRKQEFWVIADAYGEVDIYCEQFVYLSEREANDAVEHLYPADCEVIRLGRIVPEPARLADAEGATS